MFFTHNLMTVSFRKFLYIAYNLTFVNSDFPCDLFCILVHNKIFRLISTDVEYPIANMQIVVENGVL